MNEMWNIMRWCLSFVLLINGLFFCWATIAGARDIKRRPEEYANACGRLSYRQILAAFALAGVTCFALMVLIILL
jgi:hypothetical protein